MEQRLVKATSELGQILVQKQRKKVPKTVEMIKLNVQQILQKHHMKDFFEIDIEQITHQIPVRAYKNSPSRMEKK